MAMSQAKYDALIERLSREYSHRPKVYYMQVAGLMVLGFGYLTIVLLLTVGVSLAVIIGIISLTFLKATAGILFLKFGKLIIGIFALSLVILKALWFRPPAPWGIKLKPAENPELFELLKSLRKRLKTEPVHHVVLDNDYNCSVFQRPLPIIGFLGFSRNYLILGLPFLQSMSPENFQGVLGHELGHLSNNHSRFRNWIYRLRIIFGNVMDQMEVEEHWGMFMFKPFYGWFIPYFNAYTFVLARTQEYEADQCAVEVAGVKAHGDALIEMTLMDKALDNEFYKKLGESMKTQPDPPGNVYKQTAQFLREPLPAATATRYYDEALKKQTHNHDTHPSLTDRLNAIKYPISYSPPAMNFSKSAADYYIGNQLTLYTHELSEAWQAGIVDQWHESYSYYREIEQELTQLELKKGRMTLEEMWLYAKYTQISRGDEAAVALIANVLRQNPEHVSAHFLMGKILLKKQDSKGLVHMQHVLEKDVDSYIMVQEEIYYYYERMGDHARAKEAYYKIHDRYDLLEKAEEESVRIDKKDQLEPHNLSAQELQHIQNQLAPFAKQIKKALLVRKILKCFPERETFILGVERKKGWFELNSDEKDLKLHNRILYTVAFERTTYVFSLMGHNKGMIKVMEKVAGSLIMPTEPS